MRKFSSAGQENLLVPDKAEISSVLDKAENPLVADTDKNLFVPVKKTLFFLFFARIGRTILPKYVVPRVPKDVLGM